MNLYDQFLGDPGKLDWDLNRYDEVTAQIVKQFVATTLTDNSRIVMNVPAQVDAVTPPSGACRQAVFRSGKDVRGRSRRKQKTQTGLQRRNLGKVQLKSFDGTPATASAAADASR